MEDTRSPEIFARYYQEVYKDLYRYALYVLKNQQDAEDVTAETVMDAYASFQKLRDLQAFRGWIFKIQCNKCKGKLKEYIHKNVELSEELGAPETMEDAVWVRQVFHSLTEEEQLLIGMKVFGGYKSHEIGTIMNLNENTVRSKIQRGLFKMRSLLA